MKRIATIVENGKVAGVVHGPDLTYQQIVVNGKAWMFDFDDQFGPLWLCRNGKPRENQEVPQAVWKEFQRWMKARKQRSLT